MNRGRTIPLSRLADPRDPLARLSSKELRRLYLPHTMTPKQIKALDAVPKLAPVQTPKAHRSLNVFLVGKDMAPMLVHILREKMG